MTEPSTTAQPELSDEEIVERLAVEVMEWGGHSYYWVVHAHVRWCNKCAGPQHSCPDADRFEWPSKKFWNPLVDWNDTMQVVEKLESHGWSWNQSFLADSKERWCEFFSFSMAPDEFRGPSENPRRAICLAALNAVSALSQ